MQWKQKRQSSWISYQKMTCSTASNSGRFAWSGAGIGEGSTLRVTTFLLCNFLNKKCSNISPAILQPCHVYNEVIVGRLPSNVFIPLTIFWAWISYTKLTLCWIIHAIKTCKSGCMVTDSAFLWQYTTAYRTDYFLISRTNML